MCLENEGLAAKQIHAPQTVFGVAKESEPRRPTNARFRAVVLRQHPARTKSLSMSSPKIKVTCSAIRRQRTARPLDAQLRPEDAPYTVADFPHPGRSSGRFEGDSLAIETVDPEAGFLNALSTPYPQSTQMRTEARFTADIDRLHVDILHTDPVIYRQPFVMSFEFIRVDFEVLEFGCTIEAASYEDRL